MNDLEKIIGVIIVFFLITSFIFLTYVSKITQTTTENITKNITLVENKSNYENFYGISWRGGACENIDYAKSMAYEYIIYQTGMEKCNTSGLKFYLESPEYGAYPTWQICYNKNYSTEKVKEYNDFFVWKENKEFPYNLATGWFFSNNCFRPNPDFQRQSIINYTINKIFDKIKKIENDNFTFGGYAWDVPDIYGDFWTGRQINGGKIYKLNTGYQHDNIIYDYNNYSNGRIEFYRQLLSRTKILYPNYAIVYEPYSITSFNKQNFESLGLITNKTMICKEGQGLTETNCSTTPNVFTHKENLKIMGDLASRGGWFSWFGRFGGTGDMPNYQSIDDVPDRLKIIRVIPGWDNLNNVSLINRHWDKNNLSYNSSYSYVDEYMISTTHPITKEKIIININNMS